MQKLKIGLLGGSFNPAHDGHRQISLIALRRLGLDQVWWLVSPQNPLKSTSDMASHADRMASARGIARHPKIKISDFESTAGTRYTADTLNRLIRKYGHLQFVWLMGADNLVQFRHWRNWRDIMNMLPIAIIDRPGFTHKAIRSLPALCYGAQRVKPANLMRQSPPTWTFICDKRSALSATNIRKQKIMSGKACS